MRCVVFKLAGGAHICAPPPRPCEGGSDPRPCAGYGKLNITLGPKDFFRTSVVFNLPHSTFDLGRKFKTTPVLKKYFIGPV